MEYVITKEMIKNSLVSKGDISRLTDVLKKDTKWTRYNSSFFRRVYNSSM